MTIKFQSGGTAPFVSYTPLNFNTASNYDSSDIEDIRKTKSSDSKESGKLTEKDLLMAIKDLDALPSDSAKLYDQMVDFIRMQEMGFIDPSMLATQFIRMQQHMKDSVYRKGAFEEAYKNVKENNGLNEYAVTDTGDIVVADNDGGIKFASIEQVLSGEYKPLTNSDLLRLRAESYAGNDTLTQIVSNGIGMEKIVQLINQAMKSVGSSQETYEGFSRDPFQKATVEAMQELQNKINTINSSASSDEEKQKAINELQTAAQSSLSQRYAGATEQGLYKYTESNKNSNGQLEYALNYIYNVLPKNARTILNLHSGGNGKMMIGSLLASTASTEHSLKWDMLEDVNGTKPGTKESADSQKFSVAAQFIKGRGQLESFIFQDGTQDGMQLIASTMPITNNGNPIGITTAKDIFSSDYGTSLDSNNISIAGQIISASTTNHIVQKGFAHNVDMPLDQEWLAKGKKVPDLDLMRRKLEADKIIEDNKYTSIQDKNRVYQSNGLPIKYDDDGTLNTTSWATFAAIDVDAYSGVFPDQDGITMSRYATELTGTEEDSTVAFLNQHNGKEGAIDYDKKDLPWEGRGQWYLNDHDAIYRSTMWIPIYDNISMTLGSATQEQMNKAQALDQQAERLKTIHEDRTR